MNRSIRRTLSSQACFRPILDRLEDRLAPSISSVSPLSWDVIGLDSNNVNVGPNTYFVGVRVNTNAGGASNLVARFIEDSTDDPLIEPVGPTTLSTPSVAANGRKDFYFTVTVTRDSNAYDNVQPYHIEVFEDIGGDRIPDDGETIVNLSNRELYVEKLISQSRNAIDSFTVAGKPAVNPADPQPVQVFVGETLTVTVAGKTATQGYEELVFATIFPTSVFEILNVSQTYDIPLASGPNPNDRIFADAGVWSYAGTDSGATTNSNNSTNKSGGDPITSVYTVRVIGTGSGRLESLINDFSGSSFHYNADFDTGVEGVDYVRFVSSLPTTDLQITKTDGSATYVPGSTTTYTLVATNAGSQGVTGATVTDTLPSLVSSATWTVAYTGGGSGPASGTGNINASVNLPAGATATFTLTANVRSNATGNLVNTASIAVPSGVTDSNTSNNTATDTNTPAPRADLQVTKTDGTSTYVPGQSVIYTLVATNAGPSDVTGATLTDTLPAAIGSASWTATYAGGGSGPANGSGNINASLNLPTGATATFTLTASVLSSATGNLVNTASLTVPSGVTDPTSGNNSATDTDTAAPRADLQVTKTDGVTSYVPGASVTYTIVASNAGPSNVTGATLTDTLPSLVGSATWTVAYTGGGMGPASGSGNINTSLTLPSGATATFTVMANILASATGNLVNTASLAVPSGVTDPASGNNSATDTDTPSPQADLQVTKTDGVTSYVPGESVTYTIVATNAGPSDVTGATLTDTLPAQISSAAWTVAYTGGGSGPASGSGNINASLNLPSGATATFTVVANVLANATSSLVNTASLAVPGGITDPLSGNNSATDTDTATPRADLQVTKTDGVSTYLPGGAVTYIIVASNAGPSNVTGATLTDTLPSQISSATWTVAYTGGGSGPANGSGNISTPLNLPSGATATFTVVANVRSSATGNLVNTATLAVPSGVTDPAGGNNSATDTDTPSPQADLQVTKTDGVTGYVPGESVTYTIVATDAGPSDVTGATLTDTLPAQISSATWTVAYAGGGSGPASGTGNITALLNLPSGATATFTVVANVRASATGNLVNTASLAAPSGVTDPTSSNNTATDTDTPAPQADLAITKSDGTPVYVPGGSVTYEIVARNNGPSDASGVSLTDLLPAQITGATWTAAYTAGAAGPANGSGSINTTLNLPANATATFTVVTVVSVEAQGDLVNTATLEMPGDITDPNSANNSSTDTDTRVDPQSSVTDLQITITDGVATYGSGETVTYTLVVTNAGPLGVSGATVAVPLPAQVQSGSWTVAYQGGAAGPANGSGSIATAVDLPVDATATFTLVANLHANATGNLITTGTVTPPTGVFDLNIANNSATDTDILAPRADLQLTKTSGTTTYVPGESVTYVLVASNAGPNDVSGATLTDLLPAQLGDASWSVVYVGGGTGPASGTGNITATLNLPVGATATFTLTASIPSSAAGDLVNTATLAPPTGISDPVGGNNTATDTDTVTPHADLQITKTDGQLTYVPGEDVTYTIVAFNAGPSDVTGASLIDTLPSVAISATWTALHTLGASGATSGTGDINTPLTLSAGASATFTVVARIGSHATGNLVNTASLDVPEGIVDPNSSNNSATDTDAPAPRADLQITKTDGVASYSAGGSLTYTIVASNSGPSDVLGATVVDTLPAQIESATWSIAYSGGGTGPTNGTGNINALLNLPAGATATFTLVANLLSTATGDLVNTATFLVPGGVSDPDSSNNSATDTDLETVAPTVDLQVTLTDGVTTYVPGQSVTYTIVARNVGPSGVTGATLTGLLPELIDSATWTVAYIGGGSGPTNGSGSIGALLDLPAGASATFTLIAPILPTATGELIYQVSIAPPNTVVDVDDSNNSATDTDSQEPAVPTPMADLRITQSDGRLTYVPGEPVTYTVVVHNAGPDGVMNASVTHLLPTQVSQAVWTASYDGGASGPASGSGSITSLLDLPANATATFTVLVTIPSSATGDLVNSASVAVPTGIIDPVLDNNETTDSNTPDLRADLSVEKTDHVTTFVPGESVTYTIVVSNAGPSDVRGASFLDTLASVVATATWSVAYSGGSSGPNGGTGSIAAELDLPAGSSATFTLLTTLLSSADEDLVNSAQLTPPAGTTDPNPGNNTAVDHDTPTPLVDVQAFLTGPTTVELGAELTYQLRVRNAGPSDASDLLFIDTLPVGTSFVSLTQTGGPAFITITPANGGNGQVNLSVNRLEAGTEATWTLVLLSGMGSPSRLTNEVSANTTAPESDYTNNEAAVVTSVFTRLSGQLFADLDGDGQAGQTEPGIPETNVTILWLGPDGVPGGGDDRTFATVSAEDGTWGITEIPAGFYQLQVDGLPNGLTVATVDPDGVNTPNQANASSASGAPLTGLDFGYRGNASLAGQIWIDQDGNGILDAGEPGLPLVDVQVLWLGFNGLEGDADDVSFAAQTDAEGRYSRTDLPAGAFRVQLDSADLPSNLQPTADPDGVVTAHVAALDLAPAEARANADFGDQGNTTLESSVWYDIDGDGIRDENEPGLPDVVVTLLFAGNDGDLATGDDNLLFTTTTDVEGRFRFTGLPAGSDPTGPPNYQLSLSGVPADLATRTFDADGVASPDVTLFTLAAGASSGETNFGYRSHPESRVSGSVWEDRNANGRREDGEPGLGNALVELYDAAGVALLATATTDPDGLYQFPGLLAGDYQVRFLPLTGYTGTPRDQGDDDTLDSDADAFTGFGPLVSLTAEFLEQRADAGYFRSVTIGDLVWYDINLDGVQNEGEPGVPGAVVNLVGNGPDGIPGTEDDINLTATTEANGHYQLTDLIPGDYTLFLLDQPQGLTNVVSGTTVFTLVSGEDRTDLDLGVRGPGTVGNRLWFDFGRDGIDNAEPGIPGATVSLTWFGFDDAPGGDDITFSAITTETGEYLFEGLPRGNYSLTVDSASLPPNVVPSFDLDTGTTTPDGTTALVLTFDDPLEDNADFGFAGEQSVAGRLWVDYDGDGARDPDEPPLANVTIAATWAGLNGQLGDFDDAIVATTTGTDGSYSLIGLLSGLYLLTPSAGLPAGVRTTLDPDGDLDGTVTFTLDVENQRTGLDFAYQGDSSLAGFVYRDFSVDDVRQLAGANPETGVGGVTITLGGTDAAGNTVQRVAITAADGSFSFTGLIGGNYTLTETQPASAVTAGAEGYYDGLDSPGTINGTRTGTNPIKNRLAVTLGPGESAVEFNFGENPAGDPFGFVYVDLNENGRRDTGEPGLAGVQIQMAGTAFAGTALSRTLSASDVPGGLIAVTDANGEWRFPVVPPGTYTFSESQPTGFRDGLEQDDDPNGPAVTVGNDRFENVSVQPFPIRGPFNFAEIALNGSITGSAYLDRNANGIRDPEEMGLRGITVTLTGVDSRGQSVSATVTTDATGNYTFRKLRPGTYQLQETQPTEFLDGPDAAGSLGGVVRDDLVESIVLGVNASGSGAAFGERGLTPSMVSKRFFLASTPAGESLPGVAGVGETTVNEDADPSGFVFVDQNDDGVRDEGEPGIAGVPIELTGITQEGLAVALMQLTNKDGYYQFDNLQPGIYSLQERQPLEYRDGRESLGTLGGVIGEDRFDGIVLLDGANGHDYNFGELPPHEENESPPMVQPAADEKAPGNAVPAADPSKPSMPPQPTPEPPVQIVDAVFLEEVAMVAPAADGAVMTAGSLEADSLGLLSLSALLLTSLTGRPRRSSRKTRSGPVVLHPKR